MFAHDLHVALAFASGAAMVVVAVEGAVRLVRASPPSRFASGSMVGALFVVGMAAAAGLAMLVRGERPQEGLHYVYAVLAFGLVPTADSLAVRGTPRHRGLARLLGALLSLGVILRLFATG